MMTEGFLYRSGKNRMRSDFQELRVSISHDVVGGVGEQHRFPDVVAPIPGIEWRVVGKLLKRAPA